VNCGRSDGNDGMLVVFAQYERDILRDRVKAGIAKAPKNGTPHGRSATVRMLADVETEVRRILSRA
jgi:DNA invertase Pin-like site-specific DNA recombinase